MSNTPFRANTALYSALSLLLLQTATLHAWAETPSTLPAPTPVDGSIAPLAAVTTNGNATSTLSGLPLIAGKNMVIDFAHSPFLNLTGNFRVPSGTTIYAISTNPNVQTATIKAPNILILPGAAVTSVLPTSGLEGFANAISGLSLSLIAVTNFVNQGTVSSAGNLNVFAGNQLVNSGATASNAGGVMQALGNINLFSPNIVNQGMITSIAGNININNPTQFQQTLANDLLGVNLSTIIGNASTINAVGGTFSALNNAINIGGEEIAKGTTFSILGGDFLSKAVNLNVGKGILNATLGEVTGEMNVSGCELHVGSTKGTLFLGNITATGDPTFFNANGDVVLAQNLVTTASEDIAILASGNVDLNGKSINTAGSDGAGHNLVIVAGALLTPSAGSTTSGSAFLSQGSLLTAGSVSAKSNTLFSGSIFSTGGTSSISTSATGPNKSAGNVTLITFHGLGGSAGISDVAITSNGTGTGKNGSLLVVAGGTNGDPNSNGIVNLSFTSQGATGGPGTATIAGALPTGTASFSNTGKMTGNIGIGKITGYGVKVGPIIVEGGDIDIKGGAVTSTGIISSAGAANTGQKGGDISISSTVIGGPTRDIDLTGGMINSSGANAAPGTPAANVAGKPGGNAGSITITQLNGVFVKTGDLEAHGGIGGEGGDNRGGGKGGNAGSIKIKTENGSIQIGNINSIRGGGKGGQAGLGSGGAGGAGGNGSIINISATNAPLIFIASINVNGAGADGGSGWGPWSGGNGGSGGSLRVVNGTGILTPDRDLSVGVGKQNYFNGGIAGSGGPGLEGPGGNGGTGGAGGLAGTVLLSTNSSSNITGGYFFAIGGSGGPGGSGGVSANNTPVPGGNGGAGGIGQKGGIITISPCLNLTLDGLVVTGGDGGAGGFAGGGHNALFGSNAGLAGPAQAGGDAGEIHIGLIPASVVKIFDLTLVGGGGGTGGEGAMSGPGGVSSPGTDGAPSGKSGSVTLVGGSSMDIGFVAVFGTNGGYGGAGGSGFSSPGGGIPGGNGASGGNGAAAGAAGNITISSKSVRTSGLFADGGTSGFGGKGGDGGEGENGDLTAGGAGANGGDVVRGGMAGTISVTATNGGDIIVDQVIPGIIIGARGGPAGAPGEGGRGGNGSIGGAGGNSGHGADGGTGNSITFRSTGNVTALGLSSSGGAGSIANLGGTGGGASKVAFGGGIGGGVLSPGHGGDAGPIIISAGTSQASKTLLIGGIFADGGMADIGPSAGGGGGGGNPIAGAPGGNIGTELVSNASPGIEGTTSNTKALGVGGKAGSITINAANADTTLNSQTISSSAGSVKGELQAGDGGPGGSIAYFAGSTITQAGGTISINAKNLTISGGGIIQTAGGDLGIKATSGSGFDGNNGSKGGNVLGFASAISLGAGGSILISTPNGSVTNNGAIRSLGGSITSKLQSGFGGSAAFNGGNAGNIGNNASAGSSGLVRLTVGDNAGVGLTGSGTIQANGGNNSYDSTAGAGGDNGLVTGNGGNAGSTGNAGNAGAGGTVVIQGSTGTVNISAIESIGGTTSWTAVAGRGGNGGSGGGRGGNSGSIGIGGNGGKGGTVNVTTSSGVISSNINVNGGVANDIKVFIDAGGSANSPNGVGGRSGSTGRAGNGGSGGNVNLKTTATGGAINPIGITADGGIGAGFINNISNGGDGKTGGPGGSFGGTGNGGNGGNISINADSISITPGLQIHAIGGAGASQTNTAGGGGNGTFTGGAGGSLGLAGNGGTGGDIALTVRSSNSDLSQSIFSVSGGDGGNQSGQSGSGGQNGLMASSSTGGAGGAIGKSGSGANAGTIKIDVSAGSVLTLGQLDLIGGDAGQFTGKLGNGGNGVSKGGNGGNFAGTGNGGDGGAIIATGKDSGIKVAANWSGQGGSSIAPNNTIGGAGGSGLTGGKGGSLGASGNSGDGGKITVNTGTFYDDALPHDLNVSGGDYLALGNVATAGKGGDGVGATAKAGAGGSVGNFGKAGAGGTVSMYASINFNFTPGSNVLAQGGSIKGIVVANGGEGGNSVASSGFTGGNGGNIGNGPSTGKGGAITLKTDNEFAPQSNLCTLVVDGGNNNIFTGSSGKGGDGRLNGKGGNSGTVGSAGIAGSGGSILVTTAYDLTLPAGEILSAKGGKGATFSVNSGSGGAGGTGATSTGGNSGTVGNNGNAGNGGTVSVKKTTVGGIVTLGTISSGVAIDVGGGSTGQMSASSGIGGSGSAKGGNSGNVGNGGTAGNAGSIILNLPTQLEDGTLSAIGGNQAAFSSSSGNAGKSTLAGAGGNSGNVGNAGNAGNGGTITLSLNNAIVSQGNLLVNGGSFLTGADYTGKSGDGGDGSTVGGNAGNVGSAGNAGSGGKIVVNTTNTYFNINTTDGAIVDASGGTALGLYQPLGGTGGGTGVTGGKGGSVGSSSAGGNGGIISITGGVFMDGGPVGSFIFSNGQDGSANGGQAGSGGTGVSQKGGAGGAVGNAGAGGNAGNITLNGLSITVGNAPPRAISANGGKGGDQNGIAGNGGVGTLSTGAGGNVAAAGNGGNGGKVTISVPNNTPVPTVNFGTGGLQNSLPSTGNPPGKVGPAGKDGTPGTISMDDSDNKESEIDAVSFVQSVPVLETPQTKKSNNVPLVTAALLCKEDLTEFSGWANFDEVEGSKYVMRSGSLILAPQNSKLELATPAGVVSIQPGAKAIVHLKNGYLALLNLHDQHQGQVVLHSHDKEITAGIGQEIIVGPDCGSDLSAVNPCPEVALRDVKSHTIKGGLRVFRADFSLLSALMNHSTLKSLKLSESVDHKRLLERLLKNTIVINFVTAKHGVYKGTARLH